MKKIVSSIATSIAAAALTAAAANEPITLENVSFRQDRASQRVYVTYDLVTQGVPALVTMDFLTNGVSIGWWHIKTLSGDVSMTSADTIGAGTGKEIVWDAHKDWRDHVCSNASVKVYAWYPEQADEIPGVYMVVDVSGGPNAEHYPVSYSMRDPDPEDDVNLSSKIWLRRVDAGDYMMGMRTDPTNEMACTSAWQQSREVQHHVMLTQPFFIGVFPITQAQYTNVMPAVSFYNANAPYAPAESISYDTIRGSTNNLINWPGTSNEVYALSFLGKLRSKTGDNLFDLPTEAQWEYCCRAGTVTSWNNGTDITNYYSDANMNLLGWYGFSPEWKPGESIHTMRVGMKLPNAWNLYDCHGNVCEFCRDWYANQPGGEENPMGPTSGTVRSKRGGRAWEECATARSAARASEDPAKNRFDTGFRIVRSPF